jgi:hypothetical protein
MRWCLDGERWPCFDPKDVLVESLLRRRRCRPESSGNAINRLGAFPGWPLETRLGRQARVMRSWIGEHWATQYKFHKINLRMTSLSYLLMPGAFSVLVFTVEMDSCAIPPFKQSARKGWGTQNFVNTQFENAPV